MNSSTVRHHKLNQVDFYISLLSLVIKCRCLQKDMYEAYNRLGTLG
jgi:hypothetical protein